MAIEIVDLRNKKKRTVIQTIISYVNLPEGKSSLSQYDFALRNLWRDACSTSQREANESHW